MIYAMESGRQLSFVDCPSRKKGDWNVLARNNEAETALNEENVVVLWTFGR